MPQEGGLIPRVTVGELIGFVRGTYPRPLPLDQILQVTDLAGLAKRRVDRLSGGQAQRVRFALAVAGNPDLIVLDEPTAALDVGSRRQLWTVIRGWAAQGKTVLFSTHQMEKPTATRTGSSSWMTAGSSPTAPEPSSSSGQAPLIWRPHSSPCPATASSHSP
jgi:ABC-type multidrug transport system ATPase subunit